MICFGKSFEILLTNNLNLQDVSVSITVDGNPIGRYYLAPGQKMLPGIYVSENMTKPFLFRNLVFNGTAFRLRLCNVCAETGCIR